MSVSQVVGRHAIAFVHAREVGCCAMVSRAWRASACHPRTDCAFHLLITRNHWQSEKYRYDCAQRGVRQLRLQDITREDDLGRTRDLCESAARPCAIFAAHGFCPHVVLISGSRSFCLERFAEVDAIRRLLAEKQSQCDVLVRAMNRRLACVGFVRSSAQYFRKCGLRILGLLCGGSLLLLLVLARRRRAPLGFALADQATEIKEEPWPLAA